MATLLFCDVFAHDPVNRLYFAKGFDVNILRLMSLVDMSQIRSL